MQAFECTPRQSIPREKAYLVGVAHVAHSEDVGADEITVALFLQRRQAIPHRSSTWRAPGAAAAARLYSTVNLPREVPRKLGGPSKASSAVAQIPAAGRSNVTKSNRAACKQ